MIFRSKRKNDRVDTEKLAKLLFLDEVPRVHVPDGDVRSWRRMIRHRQNLIRDRARVKNGIRTMLKSQRLEAPRGLWSKRGLAWLEAVDLATELDAIQRDVLLERLRSLDLFLDRVDRVLDEKAGKHPGVQWANHILRKQSDSGRSRRQNGDRSSYR